MKIAHRMQSVRDAFPACRMIVYADLKANMVLSTSADTSLPQEQLNDFCATAVDTLSGASVPQLADIFAQGQAPGVYEVIILDRSEIGVFLKSVSHSNDAFCCVCTRDIPLNALLQDLRQHLEAIGAGR